MYINYTGKGISPSQYHKGDSKCASSTLSKNIRPPKKTTLIVNGKFDKAAIMRAAWEEAKGFASLPQNAGRKACEFFAAALKSTWKLAKA
ncbi:hypothetical protein MWH03_01110 [Klebsiella pneumoniae]|nr:hypothetical protein [Klebsiella pneumoniae]